MKNLLVVVDMVNGFIHAGNLADKSIQRIVPNIVGLIKDAKQNGDTIIAFRDSHTVNDEEFKTYPPHCVIGTLECELVPEIKAYQQDMILIDKSTTNGFATLKFDALIRTHQFDEVTVCGCCTDICVYNFVESLQDYFKKHHIHTKITVCADAVDTFHGQNHEPDEINTQYLNKMKDLGVKIAQKQEISDEKSF